MGTVLFFVIFHLDVDLEVRILILLDLSDLQFGLWFHLFLFLASLSILWLQFLVKLYFIFYIFNNRLWKFFLTWLRNRLLLELAFIFVEIEEGAILFLQNTHGLNLLNILYLFFLLFHLLLALFIYYLWFLFLFRDKGLNEFLFFFQLVFLFLFFLNSFFHLKFVFLFKFILEILLWPIESLLLPLIEQFHLLLDAFLLILVFVVLEAVPIVFWLSNEVWALYVTDLWTSFLHSNSVFVSFFVEALTQQKFSVDFVLGLAQIA